MRMVLLLAVLLTSIGLSVTQSKISGSPLSKSLQKAFLGQVFTLIFCFSTFWSASSLKEMDHEVPQNGERGISVLILEGPVEKAKTYSYVVQPESCSYKLLIYLAKDSLSDKIHPGSFIQMQSQIKQPENFSPDFDYRRYLKTKGIIGTGYVKSGNWKYTNAFPVSCLTEIKIAAMNIRDKLCDRIDRHVLDMDQRALLHAMLLGDKSDLTTEQKEAYRDAGLSHLLALSGMHIGFITLLLGWLSCWCSGFIKKAITLSGTWGFIFLVGLPVSAVRAGLMLTFILLNPYPEQRSMAMDRWALAGILLIFIQPVMLLDLGFQLSFMAVAGILLFQPFKPRFLSTLPKSIQDGLWICISAQLAVLPLSLYHFGTFPVCFLLANLTVGLVLTPLVMYLTIGVLMSGEMPILGECCSKTLQFSLKVQQGIINFIQSLPGAQVTLNNFHTASFISSYVAIAFLLKYLIKRDSKSIIHLQVSIIILLACWIFGI